MLPTKTHLCSTEVEWVIHATRRCLHFYIPWCLPVIFDGKYILTCAIAFKNRRVFNVKVNTQLSQTVFFVCHNPRFSLQAKVVVQLF